MAEDRTRKIVITGVLSAIVIFLGITRLGFIPWFAGFSLTIMHIPVILGAILEGPIVGLMIGLLFGVFSLIMSTVAPGGVWDPAFANPLISILPRLFIGPVAWLVYKGLSRYEKIALIGAGIVGSLTNTLLVLTAFIIWAELEWNIFLYVFVINGLPEAVVSFILVLSVVSVLHQIKSGGDKKGSKF